MALSSGVSSILSGLLALLLMAGLQFFKNFFISSKFTTILAGYLGSLLFILTLTSISNFEMHSFGNHFQAKYVEVIFSLIISLFAVGLVHRVAITTCFIFSVVTLYFINKISNQVYQSNQIVLTNSKLINSKKRKN